MNPLLTDLYQLTMAQGYWKSGMDRREAVFHLFFRKNPFAGGFTIACGLADAVSYLNGLSFDPEALAYLASMQAHDGTPLFHREFLRHLGGLRWGCDVEAVAEGTVVFPNEPLLRVQGPLLECQFVETTLLNILNFQSLIATKAARVCLAAQGDPVLEFGLRRAQGSDGALSASRAAYIGGCSATSNVLAGQRHGIPVRGTHAHSWVMAFDSEPEAFRAYAEAMPNNCVFLVDTYGTLDGVRHAITEGRRLRDRGQELLGIRLDSGDLAWLSIEARRLLDEAGFSKTQILASNDLDEQTIASLKQQGAKIDLWGVGTKLVTAYDQPALGGVYKLAAIRATDGTWRHKVKLSEQAAKISNPGIQQLRRFRLGGEFIGDLIYSVDETSALADRTLVDPLDATRRKHIPAEAEWEDLLVPVMRKGARVAELPSIATIRERVQAQLGALHPGIKRFLNPHTYPVGVTAALWELRARLVAEAREHA